MKRYTVKKDVPDTVTITGSVAGKFVNKKPLNQFTPNQIEAFISTATESTKEKYFALVKEKVENDKAKKQEPKKEATNTNEQDGKESIK